MSSGNRAFQHLDRDIWNLDDGQWFCKSTVSEPGKGSDSFRALDLKCEPDWTAQSMRGNFIYENTSLPLHSRKGEEKHRTSESLSQP